MEVHVSLFRPKHWLVNTNNHKVSHCSGHTEVDQKYHKRKYRERKKSPQKGSKIRKILLEEIWLNKEKVH